MKVALELQPCCGNRSGIGTYTYELSKRLRNQNGLEFLGNVFDFCSKEKNCLGVNEFQFPVQKCSKLPYSVYRRIWNYVPISYWSLFESKADIGVFFDYIIPPRFSGKAIQVIHDLSYLQFPETMSKRNLRRLQDGLMSSVERSDRIVTISEFSRTEIIKLLHVPGEKIDIVSPAPANSIYAEECISKEMELNLNIRKPYILYVGTIEPRKNLVRLIRAFEHLKQVENIPHQLVLAGGPGWGNKEIYETARKSSCVEDIQFTGYVSDAEKSALYRNADAFVFPSLYEGFGIPPLEAMEMNCPVICANAASLPEVVGEAARLVEPLDEESIADGILLVLTDKDYADSLRKKGQEQFKKYTWDDSAKRLTEVCRRVSEEL